MISSGLTANTNEKIRSVFEHYPEIESAVLYGSRAKGNFRPGSDIDLVIKGEKLDLVTLNKISNELDDLLLPNRIDLSIFHHIKNDKLLDHIHRVGRLFYKRI